MSSFLPVTLAGLQSKLDGLKKQNAGQKPFTNYFLQRLESVANLRVLEFERGLCFLHDEWDFARLYFHAYETAGLEKMMPAANWPAIVVCDWISKDSPAQAEKTLATAGFHLHATYDRILCKNIRHESPNVHRTLAKEADLETIHSSLFRVFDKYADHIMPVEELRELIAKNLVLLSRDPRSNIDGLVVFPVNGKSCNFNFLYNNRGAAALAQLLGNFYGLLTERGIESGFSWVRRTRPLVMRLHESFGWKKDGLVDYIYLR